MNTSLIDLNSPADTSRRRFLGGAVALASGLIVPSWATANTPQDAAFWAQPRWVDIYRPALGNKRVRSIYWRNGGLDTSGYRELCNLFQDHRAQKAAAIDPRLFDLLCAMQAWLRAYGYDRPLRLNSGYRTPGNNAKLEGAARNSMHLYGRAADVIFEGLPTAYVGKLAQAYSGGGVGFYYSSGFVHVDTGRVRTWRGG